MYSLSSQAAQRRRVGPKISPIAATLASFATFGVGFIARPIGGIVMGHFGDRVGRKSMPSRMCGSSPPMAVGHDRTRAVPINASTRAHYATRCAYNASRDRVKE